MERPEQHQIDSQAENILRRMLPSNWVCSNIDPDYGIDHHIEPADETKLTGLVVDVQLKGKRRVKGSKPPSYALETKHLDYYLSRRQPLFLIVIDKEREIGYWVFTQNMPSKSLPGRIGSRRKQ